MEGYTQSNLSLKDLNQRFISLLDAHRGKLNENEQLQSDQINALYRLGFIEATPSKGSDPTDGAANGGSPEPTALRLFEMLLNHFENQLHNQDFLNDVARDVSKYLSGQLVEKNRSETSQVGGGAVSGAGYANGALGKGGY